MCCRDVNLIWIKFSQMNYTGRSPRPLPRLTRIKAHRWTAREHAGTTDGEA